MTTKPGKLLQVAENAQPLADNAADKMDEAAHVAATRAVEVTDAAAEDIQNVAHATGQAGVQATEDISKVWPGSLAKAQKINTIRFC
jgi:hypothetical protein